LVERLNGIQEVRGSNPLGSTIRFSPTILATLKRPLGSRSTQGDPRACLWRGFALVRAPAKFVQLETASVQLRPQGVVGRTAGSVANPEPATACWPLPLRDWRKPLALSAVSFQIARLLELPLIRMNPDDYFRTMFAVLFTVFAIFATVATFPAAPMAWKNAAGGREQGDNT
jgi:hypothetical protein